MDYKIFEEITKNKSTTFYKSTRLFPKEVRQDVYVLYAFLRTADDLADEARIKNKLLEFKHNLFSAIENQSLSSDPIISGFVLLYRKYHFEKSWLEG